MTSYYVRITKCPMCAGGIAAMTVGSCNTIDAVFYTDGFVDGPMYDEGSALVICPLCKQYLWSDGLPKGSDISDSEYFNGDEHRSLPLVDEVRRDRYQEALRQAPWNDQDQEKYVRIRAWWSFNIAYRDPRFMTSPWPGEQEEARQREELRRKDGLPPEQEDNLRRLSVLLDADNLEEQILNAEILRELGEFEVCLKRLDQRNGWQRELARCWRHQRAG